jgi:hypothetical protein
MKSEENGLTPSQKLGYLEADNLRLRQENTRLRKALHENSRHTRRIEKAHEDALLLATFFSAGIIPSRRYAKLHGLTQNRWQNALGLLKLARVVVNCRHWVVKDFAVIEARLSAARDKAIEDRQLFFLRLNRHAKR